MSHTLHTAMQVVIALFFLAICGMAQCRESTTPILMRTIRTELTFRDAVTRVTRLC